MVVVINGVYDVMYSVHDGIHMPPVMSYIVGVMSYIVGVMSSTEWVR